MNENDINELLNNALGGNTVRQDFKNQLLQNSTNAFTECRIFHKRLRISGLILLIAAITTVAFVTGRFSVNKKISQHQIVQQNNNNDNNISVSRDLVVWLDAAKFFNQLGMPERAEFSYKQASQLIPADIMQDNIAGTGQNIELAKILNYLDRENMRVSKQGPKEHSEKITNKILAQNFGD